MLPLSKAPHATMPPQTGREIKLSNSCTASQMTVFRQYNPPPQCRSSSLSTPSHRCDCRSFLNVVIPVTSRGVDRFSGKSLPSLQRRHSLVRQHPDPQLHHSARALPVPAAPASPGAIHWSNWPTHSSISPRFSNRPPRLPRIHGRDRLDDDCSHLHRRDIQMPPDSSTFPESPSPWRGRAGPGRALSQPDAGRSLLDSFFGALVGAAIPLFIIGAYWLVRHAEGMGLGDVKCWR